MTQSYDEFQREMLRKMAEGISPSYEDLLQQLAGPWQPLIRQLQQTVAELTRNIEEQEKALQNCAACVDAAEAEGLQEVLAELETDERLREYPAVDRLIDLVKRRLVYARNYATGEGAP